jgi:hypothetical protein
VNAKPTITAVTPNAKPRGGTYDVVITGSGYQSGLTVAFLGDGIHVNTISGNATTLNVNITISGTATQSNRAVTVTNPDGGTVTKTGVFRVT